MKKIILLSSLIFLIFQFDGRAQEKYGQALNVGVGIGGYAGYFSYSGRTLPVINVNYELDLAPNITLAPFASLYINSDRRYWGNNNTPDRYYKYREVVIPIGIKGTYYLDDIIDLTSEWDVYVGGSGGVALVISSWDAGYLGDKNYYHSGNPIFFDLNIGATYHVNNKTGIFIDLSSGISTIGVQLR
ncbi:MAG: hypothetical protein RIB47_10950 [Cyclobacteriaceae bacterium]